MVPALTRRLDVMTGTGPPCGEVGLELGVYLLGAIGAADRSAVEGHLACCADCRNVLAELAGLPGLLHRVTAGDAGLTAGSSAVAAPERSKTIPFRVRRAIMGKQNGNSAR